MLFFSLNWSELQIESHVQSLIAHPFITSTCCLTLLLTILTKVSLQIWQSSHRWNFLSCFFLGICNEFLPRYTQTCWLYTLCSGQHNTQLPRASRCSGYPLMPNDQDVTFLVTCYWIFTKLHLKRDPKYYCYRFFFSQEDVSIRIVTKEDGTSRTCVISFYEI